jgi:hypothetical protein
VETVLYCNGKRHRHLFFCRRGIMFAFIMAIENERDREKATALYSEEHCL